MARREDHHGHHPHKLHYASILPATNNMNNYNDSHIASRRSSGYERPKAV